ncbi:hypothetical protein F4823DRAFT_601045 [Ustulina deusta]|nr:hypothetical protein F4823DRAFT_601045 [Ustulina deusta]
MLIEFDTCCRHRNDSYNCRVLCACMRVLFIRDLSGVTALRGIVTDTRSRKSILLPCGRC